MIGYSSAKKSVRENKTLTSITKYYDFVVNRFLAQNFKKLKVYTTIRHNSCEWIYLYALFIYLCNNTMPRCPDDCRQN